MPDLAFRFAPAAMPLAAIALLGGCSQSEPAPANLSNRAAAVPAPPPTPREVAETNVRRRLGAGVTPVFEAPQQFNNGGATILCGRFTIAGQPAQRYIALGEDDAFVESQMGAGQMDQAVREACVNAAARPQPATPANSSDVAIPVPSMANRVSSHP